MAFINFAKREIAFRIVYYGPALSGKTTNLEQLHQIMPAHARGDMTMLSTREDRTLYFDFLPLKSRAIKGFTSRFQLYTVPGQAVYDQTRRIVLNGVDGLVFVADSQWSEMRANAESFANLGQHLSALSRRLEDVPCVLQFNKRDLAHTAPTHYLDFLLNRGAERMPCFESAAVHGAGTTETLNGICKMVMAQFIEEHRLAADGLEHEQAVAVGSP